MGKAAQRKRTTFKTGDPVVDQMAVIDAKNMFFGNLIGMGLRLAVMVLIPIIAGVQLDKRLNTSPNFTLGAFFLAIFGASYLIWKTYASMQREQLLADLKKSKRKIKRSASV